jgi:surface protein
MKGMFAFARGFNSDLSAWNVSAVNDMSYMLQNATSFSQNLCSWGPRVQDELAVTGMFLHSACPNANDPNALNFEGGPWCFDCSPVISPPFTFPFNFST